MVQTETLVKIWVYFREQTRDIASPKTTRVANSYCCKKNNINGATLKWGESFHTRSTDWKVLFLKPLEVKTGKNNIWLRPKAALYPNNYLQR